MIVTIPYRPRFPQTLIHPQLETHRFNVLVAHRRLGKTVLEDNRIVKAAVKNPLPNPRYAYIAPYLKQAKLISWDYMKRYTAPIPNVKVNEAELSIEYPAQNGLTRINLFGADNPDAMRGIYLDGAVLDEYGQFKPNVFGEVIRPAVTDRLGWVDFVGTPKGQNQFFEVYQHAQRMMAKKDPAWWCGLYRADETGVIPAAELEQLRNTLSEATFRQEFLCDFTAASDNVLITIDVVTTAAQKGYKENDPGIAYAPKIIGVDPARFGDDRSVIFRRQGLQAFDPIVARKIDNMTLAGMVASEISKWNADAIFIDAGRGEGVIDRLRQLGFKVQEVNFGGTPLSPVAYADKRSEMWGLMRDWLEQGGAIPNDPELKTDLVTPTYGYDAASGIKLESKKDIKARLGKSPDLADALALTFAFPVGKNTRPGQRPEFAHHTYDPMAAFNQAASGPSKPRDYNPFG